MKQNKVFLSFVAPAYNVSKYLDEFFSSFTKLNKEFYELIFVDDKSPEDTSAFVEKYKDKVNIKYIKNEKNLGKGFSRNVGVNNVSEKSTHVMFIDSDDKLDNISFIDEIKIGFALWFAYTGFSKTNENYRDFSNRFGKNLFPNTIWGVAIPLEVVKQIPFEANFYEDMYVNRQLVTNFKELIKFSPTSAIRYRYRRSGATSSPTNKLKFKQFVSEMIKIEKIGANTTRFNTQEIYQYYWMWRSHLKDLPVNELPDTKLLYKILFCFTGSAIRFLRLSRIVYGSNRKDAFE